MQKPNQMGFFRPQQNMMLWFFQSIWGSYVQASNIMLDYVTERLVGFYLLYLRHFEAENIYHSDSSST